MSWKGWVTLLVAIWLVISAFIPGIVDSQGANLANFLIVGILFLWLDSNIGGDLVSYFGIYLWNYRLSYSCDDKRIDFWYYCSYLFFL